MAPKLVGHTLLRVQVLGELPLSHQTPTVVDVRALGKNLLIELDTGIVLRSHLGLHGSWHRYSREERWQKSERKASLVLWTQRDVFVCFNAKVVECIDKKKLSLHMPLRRLGPDLLSQNVDLDAVVARARSRSEPEEIISDVLLDQSIASGIGNVYKSETLFVCRTHPLKILELFDDEALRTLYGTARDLMQANLGSRERRTTGKAGFNAPRLWVYGRSGKACTECGTIIQKQQIGRRPRLTFWCPGCQPWD
jgi:endonuclease-8